MNYEMKYFTDSTSKIRYHEAGVGKPVIFLHGSGVQALTYKGVLDLIASRYHVIAPDMPCFGESSCPVGFEDYNDTLIKLINSLNFESIAVVGHSLGGYSALDIASKIPLNFLALVDSAGLSIEFSLKRLYYLELLIKPIKDVFLYKDLKITTLIIRDFIKNLIRRRKEYSFTKNLIDKIALNNFTDFKKIHSKTMVLWADKDELFSRKTAEVFHNKINGSRLHFVNGNHDWCIFQAKKFTDIICTWLSENGY